MTVKEWLQQRNLPIEHIPDEYLNAKIGNRIQLAKDQMRPGKFLGRISSFVTLSSWDVNDFLALCAVSDLEFGVAYGRSVYEVYEDPTVQSCMTGGDYVDFYALNPDKVGVAYLKRKDSYYARALLWLGTFYDRVYGADSAMRSALIQELTSRGYKPIPSKLVLRMRTNGTYPYMDSLAYAYRNEGYPDSIVIATEMHRGLDVDNIRWHFSGYLRSTSGELISVGDTQHESCVICSSYNVVERDHNRHWYCHEHSRNLGWVWQDRQVVRLPVSHQMVLTSGGFYAHPDQVVQLYSGEYVAKDDLPADHVLVTLGTYANTALPSDLVVTLEHGAVYKGDLVNGQLPEFMQYVKSTPTKIPTSKVMKSL